MAAQNGAKPDYWRAANDIPIFSGTPAEDLDDCIADIGWIVLVEGWNGDYKQRVAISESGGGITKNWQDLTGHCLVEGEYLVERFETTFRPHLTLVELGVKVD